MKDIDDDEITSPLLQKDVGSTSYSPAEENSPIEQVALTVPVADDPSLPVVTFRMWTLGTLACVLLSFLNQFFWYRGEPLSMISAQIAVVPLGHLMAATLTNRIFFQGRNYEFTLNPGPFNVKEHVLITIFANSGAGNPYAIHIVSAVKIFYGKTLTFWVALIVVVTTQVLGFGWAGIFRSCVNQKPKGGSVGVHDPDRGNVNNSQELGFFDFNFNSNGSGGSEVQITGEPGTCFSPMNGYQEFPSTMFEESDSLSFLLSGSGNYLWKNGAAGESSSKDLL